ncbi:transcriptional regulator [Microbacterium sp. p3-SID338]|uniref:winged helix-turn-helix domain-containing protein n=1 Tax=unclassified Microbacterium TaxID=2609290 RepID=UPI000C8106D3|nr:MULTISPECIES: transcriptional regulator [unclassified Microbacterium]MCT1396571.1 transcriptional regulator [Microbacterium sp. p3-SID338]PMC02466.1 MarR family transcriptional regulator [Microbacterium sp. UMB0228]
MIDTDEVIHSPNRLQICAYLNSAEQAEFAVLRDLLGVADSVASKHLTVLKEAGYVSVSKARGVGRPRTWVRITDEGRAAYSRHVAALHKIIGTPPPDGSTQEQDHPSPPE